MIMVRIRASNIINQNDDAREPAGMDATGRMAQDLEYLWGKFRRSALDGNLRVRNQGKLSQGISFDPATGLDNETIKANVLALAEALQGQPHRVIKASALWTVSRYVRSETSTAPSIPTMPGT